MDDSHHKEHLSSYLKNHKNVHSKGMSTSKNNTVPSEKTSKTSDNNPRRGNGAIPKTPVPNVNPHTPLPPIISSAKATRPSITSRKTIERNKTHLFSSKLAYSSKGKGTVESLPEEIMFVIFEFLGPQDLLAASQVCQRWLYLANDNLLWQRIYRQYATYSTAKGQKQIKHPQDPPVSYWKAQCMQRGTKYRNSRALPLLKKISLYNGLPANTTQALQRAGVRWVLSLVDHNNKETTFFHSDVFPFSMSVCVRWYALSGPEMPALHKIRKLKVYAANPIFYDSKGCAVKNSPSQRSLLFETEFKWTQLTTKYPVIGSDDVIHLHSGPHNLLLAAWKDGEGLAFVSANLHANHLVKCCLLGNNNMPYVPDPYPVLKDDVDSQHGLYGYICTLDLRNQRASFWQQQFRGLFCKREDLAGGFARLQLIDPENNYDRSSFSKRSISLPWKTDVLKGIVPNACVMDLTLQSESVGKPVWWTSAPLRVIHPEAKDGLNYEFDGDNYVIEHSDSCGRIHADLTYEAATEKYFITGLHCFLNLGFVNRVFATGY